MIVINYDFVTGDEISFVEGSKLGDNFQTNCLSFFNMDIETDDIIIRRKNGDVISRKFLIETTKHTEKEICKSHNILKMFIANSFKWIKLSERFNDLTEYSKFTNSIRDYIYPLVIAKSRYGGTYSGGKFTAWNKTNIPEEIFYDDMSCMDFFNKTKEIYGVGNTIIEAVNDLKIKLKK